MRVRRYLQCLLACLTILAFPSGASSGNPAIPPVAVKCGRLIDGIGDQPLPNQVILIQDDRITTLGFAEIITKGAKAVDLGGSTCLPGLIDAHAHPLIATDDYQVDHLSHPPFTSNPTSSACSRQEWKVPVY